MTESSRTRSATLPSPSLAEDILGAVQTLLIVANGEGDIVYAAPAINRILGFKPEEVLGNGWWELVGRVEGNPEDRRRQAEQGYSRAQS